MPGRAHLSMHTVMGVHTTGPCAWQGTPLHTYCHGCTYHRTLCLAGHTSPCILSWVYVPQDPVPGRAYLSIHTVMGVRTAEPCARQGTPLHTYCHGCRTLCLAGHTSPYILSWVYVPRDPVPGRAHLSIRTLYLAGHTSPYILSWVYVPQDWQGVPDMSH